MCCNKHCAVDHIIFTIISYKFNFAVYLPGSDMAACNSNVTHFIFLHINIIKIMKTYKLFLHDNCTQLSCIQLGLITYGNEAPTEVHGYQFFESVSATNYPYPLR